MSAEEIIDTHIPEFARITTEEWEQIDSGEINPPKPAIRSRKAITRAYRNRKPLSEHDPHCDQLPYYNDIANIVINGGVDT